MDYKYIFHITLLLISSPARAWEEIRLRADGGMVAINYVYPMIGLVALSTFIGALIERGWGGPEGYQYAMLQCCATVVALFGGFYLSAHIMRRLYAEWLKQADNMTACQILAGYSMCVPLLLQALTGIWPDLGIIPMLLQFYIVYVVWEGVSRILGVEGQNRANFTIVVSALLLLCPWGIGRLFHYLNAVLN